MTRPHEETWDNGRDFEVAVSGPELDRGIDAPREILARFAPEMARALLESGCIRLVGTPGERWHTDHCWDEQRCGMYECLSSCDSARAALTKAGVIP